MKRKFLLLAACLIASMALSGCAKIELSMKVNSDKSIDLTYIRALKSDYSSDSALSDMDVEVYEEIGYKITDFEADGYTGSKLTRKIRNIDKFAEEKSKDSNLEDIDITVEKTFLKNTYSLKMTKTPEDELLGNLNLDDEDEDLDLTEEDEDLDLAEEDEDLTEDSDVDFDFDRSAIISTMDLKFKLELPAKALSNNADKVTEDGKKLEWNMIGTDDILVKFELYNIANICMVAGGALLLIIIIIVIVFASKKNKKVEAVSTEPTSVEQPTPVVETPVEQPTPVVETPVVESTPVVETSVAETPVVEAPVAETPVVETPVVETPVVEQPVQIPNEQPTVIPTDGNNMNN